MFLQVVNVHAPFLKYEVKVLFLVSLTGVIGTTVGLFDCDLVDTGPVTIRRCAYGGLFCELAAAELRTVTQLQMFVIAPAMLITTAFRNLRGGIACNLAKHQGVM